MNECIKQIIADEYHLGALDGAEVVAFAERSSEGGPTLLLSRLLEPSDQDRELGEDGLYVEVCDQSRGRYGGVVSIDVEQGCVRVRFKPEAAEELGVSEVLEIRTDALDVEPASLIEALRSVSGGAAPVTAR